MIMKADNIMSVTCIIFHCSSRYAELRLFLLCHMAGIESFSRGKINWFKIGRSRELFNSEKVMVY